MKTKQEILEALNTGEAMSHKQISAKCKRYAPAVRIEINKLVSEGRLRVARYERSRGAPHAYFDNKVHLPPAVHVTIGQPKKRGPYKREPAPVEVNNLLKAWMR